MSSFACRLHFAFKVQSGNTIDRLFCYSPFRDIHKKAIKFKSYLKLCALKEDCRHFANNNKIVNHNQNMACKLAPTIVLNNGCKMPILGLGTYELKKSNCERAVRAAIDIGYRHIDTAYLYRNEVLVGKIFNEKIREGSLRREEIFLVTKLWNIFHDPERVEYACNRQLTALNLHYIDLYLMHSPIGYPYVDDDALMPHDGDKLLTNEIDYVETYKAMERLVDLGYVRSLGVSNFNGEQLKRLIENCRIKPVAIQVECHPGLNQRRLREFCSQHNIIVIAYSPLARPKPTKPIPAVHLAEPIQNLAAKYKKTVSQIILRYLIDIGTIPIPKSSNPVHLAENISIFDFQLTKNEIAIMDNLDRGERIWKFEKAKTHKYWPYNREF